MYTEESSTRARTRCFEDLFLAERLTFCSLLLRWLRLASFSFCEGASVDETLDSSVRTMEARTCTDLTPITEQEALQTGRGGQQNEDSELDRLRADRLRQACHSHICYSHTTSASGFEMWFAPRPWVPGPTGPNGPYQTRFASIQTFL